MINLKFAWRLLVKTPFISLVAIVSLALGIGANTAIFSLIDQMLLRPLPVHDAGRLVNFAAPGPNGGMQSCGQAGDCTTVFSYPMFRDLQRTQTVFTGIAAHRDVSANLSAHHHTRSTDAMLVSGSYFPVLGVRAALGRLIGPGDDAAPGESHVVVLSYAYWQTDFGGDPAVLNQIMTVNGQSMTIVGVAPRDFTGTTLGTRPAVYVPITLQGQVNPWSSNFDRRTAYWIYLFARLKPGVSLVQARSAINVPYHAIINNVEASLQEHLSAKTMALFRSKKIVLTSGARGQSTVMKDVATPFTLLFAVTVLVLLIACANIANLLLARGAARAGEMSVRLSIGGSRGQLIAQLLAESCLLGLIGGVLGLAVARLTLTGMASILPKDQAGMVSVHLDPAVIGFAAGLTLLTSFAFGLFPALYATRPDLIAVLRAQTGQPSGGRGAARWRTSLATAQIALSMALLASAGLFIRSLANISRVDLGVKIDHVLTFGVSPELNGYPAERSRPFFLRLEDALQQQPGVSAVTTSLVPLLAGENWGNDVDVQGFVTGPDIDNNARFNEVGAGYFATLGTPLLEGREFTRADDVGSPNVAIVNQAFAKKFHLGANPVGKRMDQGDKKYDMEIVGLARDAKYSDVKDKIPPLFVIPTQQDSSLGASWFYVRTSGDPAALLTRIPSVVARLDPDLPVEGLRTMPQQVKENVFLDRFISMFSAAFAGLATLLAAIGLYGVLSYTVAQRTREIGVRMALGAAPGSVRLMVLRQVGRMTLIGTVIGIGAAVMLGRVAQSLLYQMDGSNVWVLVAAAVALALVALAAGMVPAHRAASVDPIRALRYE
jgi:predicted permease